MITIPLYTLLIVYVLALLIILLFIWINILHIFQGGALTLASLISTIAVLALIVFTLFGTWLLLRNTNWQQSIQIFDSSWFVGQDTQF